MKRKPLVALAIAAGAFALLITQFAPAQAPSNHTPCAPQATPSNDPGHDFVYWFDLYIPCAERPQAAPSIYTSSQDNTAAMQQAMLMVPAQATLIKTIDTNKVKQGDQIRATLIDKVQLKNGSQLPDGTQLIGQVTVEQMQIDGTFRLALVFTNAQFKNGEVIPIKATIVGVSGPVTYPYPYGWIGSLDDYAYATANHWTDQTLQVDQPNAFYGVDLQSRIDDSNSGNFVSKKKDEIRLSTYSTLDLAIAEQGKS